MKINNGIPIHMCPNCRQHKPLDADHWRRDKNSGTGFDRYCKLCAQKSIKAHYRRFTVKDKAIRGKIGVKCMLWAPMCGRCPCKSEHDVSACWRIAEINPTSNKYPKGLIIETP